MMHGDKYIVLNRDNRIELYRFIFTILIMIFHAHRVNNGLGHPIPLGHVFVEFFFFISGYFTYSHMYRRYENGEVETSDKSFPIDYTWRKIKRMIPYMLMTFIFYFIAEIYGQIHYNHFSFTKCIKGYSGAIFDLLLLQVTGICKNPQFNAWWYLSALAFALPIVIILFRKSIAYEGGYRWLMLASPLMIYGYFSMVINKLDWETLIGITRSGFFRGFAGLCTGGTIFCFARKLEKIKLSQMTRYILTIMEIGFYLLSILISWKYNKIMNSTFIIVFLLIAGLVITFSNQSYTTKVNFKCFAILGSITTPLYICHYSVGGIVELYMSQYNGSVFYRYLIYYGISFILAIVMLVINKVLKNEK
ncbi:MAG: acyltransferase [Acetatifactor sp.]|nr:acyltransferase [Acetatifactor sp.]